MEPDFGTWRPNILIVLSIVAWGVGFGWLGVHDPSKWQIATGLYIVGRGSSLSTRGILSKLTIFSDCISDNSNLLDGCVRSASRCENCADVLSFPGLARNTPELRRKAEEFQSGEITRAEYDDADSLKRSELSNMAFYVQSIAEIVILAIIVGIMFGVRVNDSVENNNWGLSVLIAFVSGLWFLVAMPWFLKEKRRPGQVVCTMHKRS